MSCCNVCCLIWIAFIIFIFLYTDYESWDCNINSDVVENIGCSKPEMWFGSVYGMINLVGLLSYTRIFSVVIFTVALCKISRVVAKIAQFGVVKNIWMIRGHIVFATFDIIGNIVAMYYSIMTLQESIKWK